MIAAPFQQWVERPATWSIVLFAAGWAAGWFMLWRPRTLPKPLSKSLATPTSAPAPAPASAAVGAARPPVAVVIPARNEAHIIGGLLDGLGAQRRAGDQIVVVDDHSTDGTAQVAKEHGAVVIDAPDLPAGWAGKPHACHVGAVATTAPVLVFVDADVTPGAALLDAVAFALAQSPDALVSVQPWHRPGSGVRHGFEQFSVVFNVVALMGSGAFSALGARRAGRVAFGPVLACGRDRYVAVGGHAADDVRAAILEDIALARKFGQRELFVGSAAGTSFRMYPGGRRAVIEGWTKGIAIGADAAPWWSTAATAAWVASLAGGWLVSCWFAVATAVQLAVLARRAGRFAPWVVVLHPLATLLFVGVVVRSLLARRLGREVTWRDRRLRPDQDTG